MHGLMLLGMNHTTAPLDVRERLAFGPQRRPEALRGWRRRYPSAEAVILSTCNRVELYTASVGEDRLSVERMAGFLAEFHHVDPAIFEGRVYHHVDQRAMEHLFRVTASLDSMMVGERQILGQVRDAYDAARELGTTGSALNPLFQRAISAGRQVMQRTSLGEGRLSLANVAVDCARGIFDRFDDRTILSIGAGKMAGLMLRQLQELNPRRLLIANRDGARAAELAGRFGGSVVEFESLYDHLAEADIVLTSTGAMTPIITRARLEPLLGQRGHRPLFVLDLALPRDVEPEVGVLGNVHLYNIDHLQQAAGRTMEQRRDAIGRAQEILREQIAAFGEWDAARSRGRVIDELFVHCHQIAGEELERTASRMPELSATQRDELGELARRLINRLLHEPVRAMRSGREAHVDPAVYRQAVRELLTFQRDAIASHAGETDD